MFQSSIPLYDPADPAHQTLVELGVEAEQVAADVEISGTISFQAERRRVREALTGAGTAARLDEAVEQILR